MEIAPQKTAEQIEATYLFHSFIYAVWLIILFYAVFYSLMGAYVSASGMVLGVLVLNPAALFLEKKSFHRTARFFFVVSSNFYIYSTSLGLGHAVNGEYYTLPAMMLSLLINDIDDMFAFYSGLILPIVTWFLVNYSSTAFIPPELIYQTQYTQIFEAINYFGAFGLASFFVTLFIRRIRRQQLQMIFSAKMSSLGEMAGGIAHEINNPLAIIAAKSAQMRHRLEKNPLDVAMFSEDLTKIEYTAMRIAKIIKGLRTFSRSSKEDPKMMTSLNHLIEDTLEFCREKIKASGIDLQVESVGDLQVDCRPAEISQVILNLISNSVDALESSPERWIKLSVREDQGRIFISVTDSGHGISKSIEDKIMNPFFTTKEVGKGTGLGLSISNGIVESHNGKLTLDNKSKNTRFIFDLPQAPTSP